MSLILFFATKCLDASFNDRAIDLLLAARTSTVKSLSEEEAHAQGFRTFMARPNYVMFDNRNGGGVKILTSEFKYNSKESQDKMVAEIAAKLQKGFTESRVSIRGNSMLSNGDKLPYQRYIAVEALIDGILSLDDSISTTIDFVSGQINCATSNRIDPKRYIRVGQHLTDARVKEICAEHGIANYRVERIWYPYNFVFWKHAMESRVYDKAVATFAVFTDAGKAKTALMNDLGEFSEDMNMYSWQEKDSYLVPPKR